MSDSAGYKSGPATSFLLFSCNQFDADETPPSERITAASDQLAEVCFWAAISFSKPETAPTIFWKSVGLLHDGGHNPCIASDVHVQIRAAVPMYLLSRKIKALGFKVVMSGEGADEIFGGYLYFHKAPSPAEFHR